MLSSIHINSLGLNLMKKDRNCKPFFGKEDELIYYDAGCIPGGWFEAVTGSILDTFNICFDDNLGITDCA